MIEKIFLISESTDLLFNIIRTNALKKKVQSFDKKNLESV